MITAMRLRNLRSFSEDEDNPFIDIKPITILIGKNSSGKSTFLRSFPLLRQSIEEKTGGPILWYGPYVDFGAFSEAVRSKKNYKQNIKNEDETIYFDLKTKSNLKNDTFLRYIGNSKLKERVKIISESFEITVKIGVSEESGKTILKTIEISILDITYLIKHQKKDIGGITIEINSNEQKFPTRLCPILSRGDILPLIGGIVKTSIATPDGSVEIERIEEQQPSLFFNKKLEEIISLYLEKEVNQEEIKSKLDSLVISDKETIRKKINMFFSSEKILLEKTNKKNSQILNEIHTLCVSKHINQIISSINESISNSLKQLKYLGPVRATTERYYRHQDLQIEEMDAKGANLAMIIRSLAPAKQHAFSRWTKDNFGFGVTVSTEGLHYKLMINIDNEVYNINDMGFGFSQMLPVIASLWMESENMNFHGRSQRKSIRIFAIEQPELHLHPEYQAKLARLFATIVKRFKGRGISLFMIFETHSKTMVESLGDCIEEGILSHEDLSIVLFEKDNKTKVNFSEFDKEGNLKNWPIGFFSGR